MGSAQWTGTSPSRAPSTFRTCYSWRAPSGAIEASVQYEDRDDGTGQRCGSDANPARRGFLEETTPIQVTGPAKIIVRAVRPSDNGDNDGFADPNETVSLFLTLRNARTWHGPASSCSSRATIPRWTASSTRSSPSASLAAQETRESDRRGRLSGGATSLGPARQRLLRNVHGHRHRATISPRGAAAGGDARPRPERHRADCSRPATPKASRQRASARSRRMSLDSGEGPLAALERLPLPVQRPRLPRARTPTGPSLVPSRGTRATTGTSTAGLTRRRTCLPRQPLLALGGARGPRERGHHAR